MAVVMQISSLDLHVNIAARTVTATNLLWVTLQQENWLEKHSRLVLVLPSPLHLHLVHLSQEMPWPSQNVASC